MLYSVELVGPTFIYTSNQQLIFLIQCYNIHIHDSTSVLFCSTHGVDCNLLSIYRITPLPRSPLCWEYPSKCISPSLLSLLHDSVIPTIVDFHTDTISLETHPSCYLSFVHWHNNSQVSNSVCFLDLIYYLHFVHWFVWLLLLPVWGTSTWE